MEYTYDEVKLKLNELLDSKSSFNIIGLGGELLEVSQLLEKEIEKKGMRCRIYTRNRAATATALAWTGPGLAALAGIAAHNLATYNPDYEIGRAVVDQKIYVTYKK